ncbi:MAG: aldo/keto reductase [Solirubrobacteraceae bacterium]|nr:aldo/keto reductase [Solirubrobacteraceae bacterium]
MPEPTDRTIELAGHRVSRLGLGTMSLGGRRAMGPPDDPAAAARVLEGAVEAGIRFIDTAGFYGPDTVCELIASTLSPYPGDLVIGTKVGLARDDRGRFLPALTPDAIRRQVERDLETLGLPALELVVLRLGTPMGPQEGTVGEPLDTLAELIDDGLVRHAGLSCATDRQVAEADAIFDVACVQNHRSVVDREDDALARHCAKAGIPYVAYSPTGGARGLRSPAVDLVAERHGVDARVVGLAWLLAQPSTLPIPGTSDPDHLATLLGALDLVLDEQDLVDLESAAANRSASAS